MSVRLTYRFSAVPEWLTFDPTVDDNAIRVYAVLARYGDQAFPSLSTIGDRCGKSVDTVRRGIRSLRRAGAIAVEERFDSDGRQSSNRYVLAGDAPLPNRDGRYDTDVPGTTATDPGGNSARQGRASKNESNKNESVSTTHATAATMLDVLTLFEQFWLAYPRKIGKPTAERAWRAVKGDRAAAAIVDGLARWIEAWKRDHTEVQYIPHPSTWLTQRRWEDEPPPPARRNGKPSMMEELAALRFDDAGNLIE